MSMKFTQKDVTTMRDVCASGQVEEVEFGLLKKSSKTLKWKTEEKNTLLDMRIDTLTVEAGPKTIEVRVRSLCHSRAVTVDYLAYNERFTMKKCVLVMGDYGNVPAPWAQMIQPAMHLYLNDFNVLFVEIPVFATDGLRWIQYGPPILAGALKFMNIDKLSVLATGTGGGVFLMTLTQCPELFGKTHFIYNVSIPKMKGVPFDLPEIEEMLRSQALQIWFAFNEEDGIYDRHDSNTMEGKAYDALTKMQTRLLGERQRGRRSLPYDEVLTTDALNLPKSTRVKRIKMGLNNIFAFSEELNSCLKMFFKDPPQALQADLESTGGLVGEKVGDTAAGIRAEKMPELMALKKLNTHSSEARMMTSEMNRRRFDRFNRCINDITPTALPRLVGGISKKEIHSLMGIPMAASASAPRLSQIDNSAGRLQDGGALTDSNAGSRASSRKSVRVQEALEDGPQAALALKEDGYIGRLHSTDLRRNIGVLKEDLNAEYQHQHHKRHEDGDDDDEEEDEEGLFSDEQSSEAEDEEEETPKKDERKEKRSDNYKKNWGSLRGVKKT